jgi:hypothetical protein
MTRKIKLICIGLLLGFAHFGSSQNTQFSGIVKYSSKGSGVIEENNDISGYYFFYKTDKVDRKNNMYRLDVVDKNLNNAGSKDFVDSKNLLLLDAVYNGKAMLFKFADVKTKELIFRYIDNKGIQFKEERTVIESKSDLMMFYYEDTYSPYKNLYSIKDKGFVTYGTKDYKKDGYYIKYMSSNKDSKGWTYVSEEDAEQFQTSVYFGCNDNVLISLVSKRKKYLSRDVDMFLVGHDVNSGKKMFETKVENNEFEYLPTNSFVDKNTNQTYIFGTYFKKGDNIIKDNSLGFFTAKITNNGIVSGYKYISWEVDMKKYLPVNDKGKVDGLGYLFVHDIVRDSKGNVLIVTESYKKAVSGVGIAAAALNGGSGPAINFVTNDMVVLELDKTFGLVDAKVVDKSKNRYLMPEGSAFWDVQTMAYYMKSMGAFDYRYTTSNADNSNINIAYVDYNKKEMKGSYLGVISYKDSKMSVDKVSLEVKKAEVDYMPAKVGFVAITEYRKKEKTLDVRMEKLNY